MDTNKQPLNDWETLQHITALIVSLTGLSMSRLQGGCRDQATVDARHVAMFAARKKTSLSLSKIGAYFGHRDHGTVSHAVARIEELRTLRTETRIRELLKAVDYSLKDLVTGQAHAIKHAPVPVSFFEDLKAIHGRLSAPRVAWSEDRQAMEAEAVQIRTQALQDMARLLAKFAPSV